MLAAVPVAVPVEDVPVAADVAEAALEDIEDIEDDALSEVWSEMTPPATSDWELVTASFELSW